ncbi:DUF2255 family protein [Streptomyces sp. NPDC048275]|uniref:DUF2255 family protein n=1 Tax=Streptomyces sp. NPDC048275 TaxID=3155629 RepID=UPI0033D9100A
MTTWTSEELDSVGHAEELEIASLRSGGTLGSRRTIWVVRLGDDIYVRSVNGPGSDWYRGTRARQEGRIEADGVTKLQAHPPLENSCSPSTPTPRRPRPPPSPRPPSSAARQARTTSSSRSSTAASATPTSTTPAASGARRPIR